MLYKLRNNAYVSSDPEKNSSVFVCFRKASLEDTTYSEVLSRKVQEFSVIAEKLTGKKLEDILDTSSIADTLQILEDYGFVISGSTEEELAKKEIPLYKNITIE